MIIKEIDKELLFSAKYGGLILYVYVDNTYRWNNYNVNSFDYWKIDKNGTVKFKLLSDPNNYYSHWPEGILLDKFKRAIVAKVLEEVILE